MKNNSLILRLFTSSIALKGIVAISGLFLIGFIIIHLLGNLLFYVGPEVFNLYGYRLSQQKQIYTTLEIIILIGFVTHIGLTGWTTYINRRARPKTYQKRKTFQGIRNLFSSNMALTGTIIVCFLVVHLRGIRFAEKTQIPVPGEPGALMYDLYNLLIIKFTDPIYAGFYIISVCLVGGHLSHGLQSAFKSLGLYSGTMEIVLKRLAIAFGVVIALGFGSIPFYIWLLY
ncbi:hypothetical protein COTS27_01058 [Spirochaetota bacterium]|nr:hypothetical protein COTS27_01058 [Spirochaetota bacterium]